MRTYAILTNRKRSIIALVHSVVFALIALRSAAAATSASPIWIANSPVIASVALLTIYVVVAGVLVQLARMCRSAREKLYFAFCASSAALGLLRTIFGDQNLPAVRYFRVLMLLCAVGVGIVIVRSHSRVSLMTDSVG
jgi:peptidoglycan/LPS O-acetylase OafA/YrhL